MLRVGRTRFFPLRDITRISPTPHVFSSLIRSIRSNRSHVVPRVLHYSGISAQGVMYANNRVESGRKNLHT